jgi:proteasome lid subunit RPN8/RPN11
MILGTALRAQILAEARAAFPRECCGLLEGEGERVTALHPSPNLAERADRFEIDPALRFRLLREERAIVGCYHSHPGGCADPSPRDLDGAGEDGFLWLIQGARELKAFVFAQGRFEPVALVEP